jgi:hypothetical protein
MAAVRRPGGPRRMDDGALYRKKRESPDSRRAVMHVSSLDTPQVSASR